MNIKHSAFVMMYPDIDITAAKKIQEELRQKIRIVPYTGNINTVAGADISFNKYSTAVYAGVVLLSYPQLIPLTYSMAVAEVNFPYVPGFLAFREVPALLKAWELLPLKPDILVVDGHGIAHPRRMGIAAHFGALTGQTTIGCAKKLLFGKYQDPGNSPGDFAYLYDHDETIGTVLRTKKNVKPVFVSPGNNMDTEGSLQVMRNCMGKYRIPEPTRHAHNLVNAFRTGSIQAGYHNLQHL